MGKIQYKNASNTPVEYSQPKKEKEAVSVLQNVKYDDIDKTELANACHQVFDSMVTRDFLHSNLVFRTPQQPKPTRNTQS